MRVYEVDLKSNNEPRLLDSPGEDMSTWDNTRTSQWLHSINLGQFASAFEEGNLGGEKMGSLTEEEVERVVKNNLPANASITSSQMSDLMRHLSSFTGTPSCKDEHQNGNQQQHSPMANKIKTCIAPQNATSKIETEGTKPFSFAEEFSHVKVSQLVQVSPPAESGETIRRRSEKEAESHSADANGYKKFSERLKRNAPVSSSVGIVAKQINGKDNDVSIEDWFNLYPASPVAVRPSPLLVPS
eukprot:CAMPEP_0198219042 /NCGR_PEP_ID=MMETSP1445-20131203/72365_1 /TAXON_ID=36898 /ORGANISM="Pyramimonas sp., Strain CCMP2087" /LENGTH=242 /DNA_ID=CAMNT_0043896333 /DNA_START=54 /DNA_END=779 /DNA_ORIENTATION=-